MKRKIEMIREYLEKDHTEEMISEDQIAYINRYQLDVVVDVENRYEAIHLLVAIDGIIKFEIEQLIQEYINKLPNRKEYIRQIAEEIVPKEIKNCYFDQYEMIL
ncbi:TPA: hypothetical protein KNI71_002552 [Clostridioides difficile]|nr:hypothetical protein [Clostridioides difficile]